MKYFLHDSNAFNDEKIHELFMQYGYEGLGLFYTILEKLALQEKPIKTSVLKHQLKVGKKLEKCWNFLESLELISSNNGDTFNKQLLNFSEKYAIKKEKNRKKIAEWRENQDKEKNVTSYVPSSNSPKVKESKVKESKVKESNIEERKLTFAHSLDPFKNLYSQEMIESFLRYWSEPNKSNSKFRQEMEKTWDLSGRLKTWASRDKSFTKTPPQSNHKNGININDEWK